MGFVAFKVTHGIQLGNPLESLAHPSLVWSFRYLTQKQSLAKLEPPNFGDSEQVCNLSILSSLCRAVGTR